MTIRIFIASITYLHLCAILVTLCILYARTWYSNTYIL